MSGHYVQLCPNPLRFEPVTKENSVFFDEANRQVFSVTSVEEKTRVVVRGPDVKSLVIFKYVADATNMYTFCRPCSVHQIFL